MAAICILFSYGVWNWTENQIQMHMGNINTNLEQVAQVKTKSNQVLRNQTGQLLWQDIDIGEAIYIGNSIQTENNSSTEVILNGGEKILIGPESLVRFARNQDEISLQLVDGKIEVKSADITTQEVMKIVPQKKKKLIIQTPQGQLHVKDADVKIKADKNNQDNFKVEVLKGAPELVSENQEKEVLQVTAPEEQKIDVVKIEEKINEDQLPSEIKLNTPSPLSSEVLNENLKSEFVELSPNSTETVISGVNPETGIIERMPAQVKPSAPRVKAIKVKEIE